MPVTPTATSLPMASLQDQLLKAGIVDKKKVKQAKHEKHKAVKQQPRGGAQVDEVKALAQQALAEKAARDREINLQREQEAQRRAIAAQIRQLIELNRISRRGGEVAYQFTDGRKIKKLYVTETLRDQLGRGLIAVVRLGEEYELIPAAVADKIRQRDAAAIVVHNLRGTTGQGPDEDDPYAAYQIPDDLMW